MDASLGPNLRVTLLAGMLCFAAVTLFAKPPAQEQKLAPPPKWTADDLNTFFPDARTKLVGARPDFSKSSSVATNSGNAESPNGAKGAGGWSKLIDAETIETEIKRSAPQIAKATATPS